MVGNYAKTTPCSSLSTRNRIRQLWPTKNFILLLSAQEVCWCLGTTSTRLTITESKKGQKTCWMAGWSTLMLMRPEEARPCPETRPESLWPFELWRKFCVALLKAERHNNNTIAKMQISQNNNNNMYKCKWNWWSGEQNAERVGLSMTLQSTSSPQGLWKKSSVYHLSINQSINLSFNFITYHMMKLHTRMNECHEWRKHLVVTEREREKDRIYSQNSPQTEVAVHEKKAEISNYTITHTTPHHTTIHSYLSFALLCLFVHKYNSCKRQRKEKRKWNEIMCALMCGWMGGAHTHTSFGSLCCAVSCVVWCVFILAELMGVGVWLWSHQAVFVPVSWCGASLASCRPPAAVSSLVDSVPLEPPLDTNEEGSPC